MRFDTRSFLFLMLLKLMTRLVTQFGRGLEVGGWDGLLSPLQGVGEGSLVGEGGGLGGFWVCVSDGGGGLDGFGIWISGGGGGLGEFKV